MPAVLLAEDDGCSLLLFGLVVLALGKLLQSPKLILYQNNCSLVGGLLQVLEESYNWPNRLQQTIAICDIVCANLCSGQRGLHGYGQQH